MNAQRFQGKVAVVTGGTSGIGLGVAKAYAQEGAHVVITGRNEEILGAAAKEIGEGTLAIRSDAGKVAEIEAAVKTVKEHFGRIDALFVNAGIAKLVPFEQITEELFAEIVGNEDGILANGGRFPIYREELAKADQIEIPVQVNGKLRSRVFASPDATDDELKELAFTDAKVCEHTDGRDVIKTIIVPKRLVNIVVKS